MADTALTAGSIAFTGYNADGADNLAFVVLQDIAAGTVINFTDKGWLGTAFATGEATWSWTATGDIAAGTIVSMDNLGAGLTASSNLGSISFAAGSVRDLSDSTEVVYAYIGSATAPTFLTAVSSNGFFGSNVLTNTGLVEGLTALNLGVVDSGLDIGAYNGVRSGPNFAELARLINTPTNWITQDVANVDNSHDGIAPDVPFSTDAFTIDPNAQLIAFDAGSLSVTHAEGDAGTTTAYTFTVVRSATAPAGTLTFSGTVVSTTADAADFGGTFPATFTGTIAEGETSAVVTILVSGDSVFEAAETFTVALTAASNSNGSSTTIGINAVATGTITNDDAKPTVINAGEVVTGAVSLAGTETLTINQGGTLNSLLTIATSQADDTLVNHGLVNSATGPAIVLNVTTVGQVISLSNEAGGVMQGQGLVASSSLIALNGSKVSTVIIDNAGSMSSYGYTINANNYFGGKGFTVNNLAGGSIASSQTTAIYGNANVNNAGLITGRYGIDLGTFATSTVNNLDGGQITGTQHAVTGAAAVTVTNAAGGTMTGLNGSAVNIDSDSAVANTVRVTNYGIMEGRSANTADSDGDGIDIDGLAIIDNYGSVKGLGASGLHKGEANVSEGIAIGGGTINNYAGATIYGYGRAIQVDNSANSDAFTSTVIYNEGTIQGDGHGPTGVTEAVANAMNARIVNREAIDILGTKADTITNKGIILGGVFTDGGNDVFNAYVGSTVSGLIDLGGGSDTVNLYASGDSHAVGTLGQLANVEILNVVSGSWNVGGFAGTTLNVGSGAVLSLAAGSATTAKVVIGNGGEVFGYGTTSNVAVQSGGAMHVYHGGSAANTSVEAGGFQNVWDASVTNTSVNGSQQILAGGSATGTTIGNGGNQFVDAGGSVSGTTVNGGGIQFVVGTSTGGSVGGGAAQHVHAGGQVTGVAVAADGFQAVFDGATVTDTSLNGYQQVLAGGVAIGTTVGAGGLAYIGAGGSTDGSVINADGLQYVDVGATATGTDVKGGYLFVGGSASDTNLVSGSEFVDAGGVQNGIDFGGGEAGVLYLNDAAGLAGTVSNFETGDIIDLRGIAVTSYDFDGTTLTLTTGEGSYAWQFANLQADTAFEVVGDGNGGTKISLSLLSQFSAGLDAGASSETALVPQDTAPSVAPLAIPHQAAA